MPLDADVSELLAQIAAGDALSLHKMTPDEARQAVLDGRVMFGEPEPVGRVLDRNMPGPDGDIPARVYTPTGHGPFPILVYFHGGGWIVGSIETDDALCRSLTNAAGCVTVSVDYRLAPEHKFPAAVEDAYAATEWVASNVDRLGGQGERVAVGGVSAGANLAAVVAMLARDRGRPSLAHQLLVYPPLDCAFDTQSYRDNGEGYVLTKDMLVYFLAQYVENEADGRNPLVSPLRAKNLVGLPPTLMITAEFDPLRDEDEAYAARLKDAGVLVETIRYDGVIHGFLQMTAAVRRAREAQLEVAEKLRTALAQGARTGG